MIEYPVGEARRTQEAVSKAVADERAKVEAEVAAALELEDKFHLKNHDWAEAADFVRSGGYRKPQEGV